MRKAHNRPDPTVFFSSQVNLWLYRPSFPTRTTLLFKEACVKKTKFHIFWNVQGLLSEVHFILTKWGGACLYRGEADGTINQGSRCPPCRGPTTAATLCVFAEKSFQVHRRAIWASFFLHVHHTSPLHTVESIKTTCAHQPYCRDRLAHLFARIANAPLWR